MGRIAAAGDAGYELKPEDRGHDLGDDFGHVTIFDIGRMVWLKPEGVVSENKEQCRARWSAKPYSDKK